MRLSTYYLTAKGKGNQRNIEDYLQSRDLFLIQLQGQGKAIYKSSLAASFGHVETIF